MLIEEGGFYCVCRWMRSACSFFFLRIVQGKADDASTVTDSDCCALPCSAAYCLTIVWGNELKCCVADEWQQSISPFGPRLAQMGNRDVVEYSR